jgi:hypothetical protein
VLIDGGSEGRSTAEQTYEYLRKFVPAPLKPVVALWIFTHAHSDHIGMATEFFEKYSEQVDVKAFCYQFPSLEIVQVSMENGKAIQEFSDVFERALRKSYPQAEIYTPHTGQRFSLFGVEMEVLYSPDNLYSKACLNVNELSLAFRLRFQSGKTVFFLGDSMHDACKQMAESYGTYLQSDILQLAHHGLIGGDRGLYEIIDPAICLWATSKERFLGENESSFRWCLGEGGCEYNLFIRDDNLKKREHIPYGKEMTLKL